MMPLVVSFYTVASGYEAEAREMVASARKFDLRCDVRGERDLGDWRLNCGMKPAYIRNRMLDHPGRPLLWVDADGRFRKKPELFKHLDCDFAAHWRHGSELLSGTLLFNATENAWQLAQAWVKAQAENPRELDQRTLSAVVSSGVVPGLKVYRLPPAYTRIFDGSDMGPEIVIEHMQASRRLAKHDRRTTPDV
jgi:hypothetical protein